MLRNLIAVFSLLAVLGTVTGQAASAEDKYPNRTITWLIPYGPAGGFDLHSRAMIVCMRKALGVNIIIRNRPGAGGKIAWDLTWGAKPDGYTISTVNIPGAIIVGAVRRRQTAVSVEGVLLDRTDLGEPRTSGRWEPRRPSRA